MSKKGQFSIDSLRETWVEDSVIMAAVGQSHRTNSGSMPSSSFRMYVQAVYMQRSSAEAVIITPTRNRTSGWIRRVREAEGVRIIGVLKVACAAQQRVNKRERVRGKERDTLHYAESNVTLKMKLLYPYNLEYTVCRIFNLKKKIE